MTTAPTLTHVPHWSEREYIPPAPPAPDAKLCGPCANDQHGDYCAGVIVVTTGTQEDDVLRYVCECECLPWDEEIERRASDYSAHDE